ncbi:MAG TPA: hypothetical protein GX512_07255 [Firmicutes bacterium]|nr:hypothetical protein [Candidatus Fermentithermobacillaceae bacterium]
MLKIGCACKVLETVENILDLLKNPRFGLKEIKDEVKDIEEAVGNLVPVKGPLSTGPFSVTIPSKIKVSVQNVGSKGCVDAVVRLFDIECCPPKQIDCKVLRNIGRCCAEDTWLAAPEGARVLEVVICPKPDKASIRGFVTVQPMAVNASNPDALLNFRACDLLPVVCPFCKKEKDRCDACEEMEIEPNGG